MMLWYVNFVFPFQDKYAIHFANNIKKAKPVSGADIAQKAHNINGDVLIKYKDQWDFENIAQQFGIFQEWKVFLLFLQLFFFYITFFFSWVDLILSYIFFCCFCSL